MKKFLLPFLLFCGCLAIRPIASQTPYITKVIEFKPAPGQFTNELPEYEEGDTEETMRAKAEEYLRELGCCRRWQFFFACRQTGSRNRLPADTAGCQRQCPSNGRTGV